MADPTWERPDAELVQFVVEQEQKVLRNYRNDLTLLREHAGQERNWRNTGYGTRQIPELFQNAADALTQGKQSGRVEFRIADGHLYVANEGAPFDRRGLEAVSYAFISPKSGEEIGQFGLGFKSVLAVTSNPQIFSRSISFEFNSHGARASLREIAGDDLDVPAMRVPTILDAASAIRDDAHLASLASWATTVLRLKLEREGARLRSELSAFSSNLLLFTSSISTLTVSLADVSGKLVERTHRRMSAEAGRIRIQTDSEPPRDWLFAQRTFAPSAGAKQRLPEGKARSGVTVSYAVDPDSPRDLGQFWAWLPLENETTARGIFNAPWEVGDDRRTMLPTSPLNSEIMDQLAELFVETTARASRVSDPAKHFSLYPARGKETRGPADSYLSAAIKALARRYAVVPDRTGRLRQASALRPLDFNAGATEEHVEHWSKIGPRDDIAHASCYRGDRRTRVRELFAEDEAKLGAREVSASQWLEELAALRTQPALGAALDLYLSLRQATKRDDPPLTPAIIPLESGKFATPLDRERVLLPSGDVIPDGLEVVANGPCADPNYASRLQSLGFKAISDEQLLVAQSSTIASSADASTWAHFWERLNRAAPPAAEQALQRVRARGVCPQILNCDGEWVDATSVIAWSELAGIPTGRAASPDAHPDRRLLIAAGAVAEPRRDFDVAAEPFYSDYVADLRVQAGTALRVNAGHGLSLRMADQPGVGPLQLLWEVQGDALVRWTESVLHAMPAAKRTAAVKTSGGEQVIQVSTPEFWSVSKRGLVSTSLGPVRARDAVGPALRRFSELLPVMRYDWSAQLGAPRTLEDVKDRVLSQFLARDEYIVEDQQAFLTLLAHCATRDSLPVPGQMPVLRNGIARLQPRTQVIIAETEQDLELLQREGVPAFLAAGIAPDAVRNLQQRWGLRTSSQVINRVLEIEGDVEPLPVKHRFPATKASHPQLAALEVAFVDSITERVESPTGTIFRQLRSAHRDEVLVIAGEFEEGDDVERLLAIADAAAVGMQFADAERIVEAGRNQEVRKLKDRVRIASTVEQKLLELFGSATIRRQLPEGLLGAIETRHGVRTDLEIAKLYADLEGVDALWHLRKELRALRLDPPKNWAGSSASTKFVQELGFPETFAGARADPRPAFERARGRIELNELHDYQRELYDQIRDLAIHRDADGTARRALMQLPTGAGKTRVAVEAIVSMLDDDSLEGPVVWIAQSEELCEQALESFAEVWGALVHGRELHLSRFWGGNGVFEADDDPQVVIATDDTLARRIEAPDSASIEWLRSPALVVIDEAHRAGSRTYTQVLEWFGYRTGRRTPAPLLGLTATPFRGRNVQQNEALANRFGHTRLLPSSLQDPMVEALRERGVLSAADHEILEGAFVSPDQKQIDEFERMKDIPRSLLQELGRDDDRTNRLVDHVLEQPTDWPILVFTPSVASAHTVAALLNLRGRQAEAVDGSMRRQQRRLAIDRFRNGQVQVLVNCDLLTTGFDAPKVRALYVGRPTYAPNRYIQMVGRALRGPANGGTDRCLIVNVADTFEHFGTELSYTEFDYLWER